MKKSVFNIIPILFVLVIASCQGAQPSATEPPAAETQPAAVMEMVDVNLEIIGTDQSKTLTMADIQAMPATTGMAGIKSSTGKITLPAEFKGVLLSDLVEEVGGLDPSLGIQVEAEDGYAITFSADQITYGDFIAYDPGTGDETENAGKLQVLLAYEMDGQPLDADRDGSLRIVIISDKNNQVTDGHWSVKWVRKILLKPLAAEWSVLLEGAINEEMDRGTFESGAAEKCHQATWTDDKAQVWTGIPLWLMVGRVDDETKHDDNAYNDELADQGYTVEVIATDGYSATFDSARVKRNDNLIVAYLMNDNPLPEKDFPLRLVGSDVSKKEGVGAIAKIILHMGEEGPAAEPQPTLALTEAAPSEPPAGDAALSISGLVESPIGWSMDQLKALDVVKVTVDHPKKGSMDVEGIRLSTLLDLAKVKPEAKTLVVTSSDGYKTEWELAKVQACQDCMLGFGDEGDLDAAMPGFDSGFWAKMVVSIEAK